MAAGTRSTDELRADACLELAIDLERAERWLHPDMGSLLPDAPAPVARAAWLLRQLSDPRFVKSRVSELPVVCLMVLEHCLERRGAVTSGDLANLLHRVGARPQLLEAAYKHLVGEGLGWWPPHNRGSFFAFRRPLWLARAQLRGLVDAPSAVASDARGRGPGRDLAAAIALVTHRPMRTTQQGSLNRTNLKSFVKGNGLDPDVVQHQLHIARTLGLVRMNVEGDLRVDVEVARELFSYDGPVALVPVLDAFGAGWMSERDMRVEAPGGSRAALRAFSETLEVDGVLHGRIATLQRPDGDGHVTPSFEVLLGPDADAWLTLVVGMVAELSRADHLLTHRITPQSVARGLAAGLTVAVVRHELERVSKRPLPDTVRSLLDDAERRSARARSVIAVDGMPSVLDSLAARLGPAVVARPSRECLLIEVGTPVDDLSAAAAAASATLDVANLATAREKRAPQPAAWEREVAERCATARALASIPLEPRKPDPRLRERFDRALRTGFADDVARLLSKAPAGSAIKGSPAGLASPRDATAVVAGSVEEAIASWDRAAEVARASARPEARYFALVADAVREVRPEVTAWALSKARPEDAASLLDHDMVSLFAFLAPGWRKAVLAVARTVDSVLDGSRSYDAPNARSALGRRAHLQFRGMVLIRPGRTVDDAGALDVAHDSEEEVLEVCRLPVDASALRAVIAKVDADPDAMLRVTELRDGTARTFCLFPEGVRTRGREDVLVGETEEGSTRVVRLSDLRRLEVVTIP